MAGPALECAQTRTGTEEAGQTGRNDDDRERNVEEEYRNERRHGELAQHIVPQCARTDANDRLNDNRENGSFQSEEQPFHERHAAEQSINVAKREDRDKAGKYEQQAGKEPALRLVQQPADVDWELLRLGAGKQDAIGERVEERLLADPTFLVD